MVQMNISGIVFHVHLTCDKLKTLIRQKMNLLSFTNYKAYNFIGVFFSWKNNLSDIWQTVVLKNMLRDGVTFQLKLRE